MVPASPYCAKCGGLNAPAATVCFACGASLAEAAPLVHHARVATAGRSTLVLPIPDDLLLRQRYHLLKQIGEGGFGAVYQAEDTQLGNRLVAIKEMQPSGLNTQELQEATEAFRQEALLLAGLAHPSLPRIYDHFSEDGHWYLVMEFIDGTTLEQYLAVRGGRLPVAEALDLSIQLCRVLEYLHTRQPPIVFRDLKPSNVMLTADGAIYLIDFGIARLFKPGQQKDTIAFGSPGYAAPEQYGKTQTTPRSDVYSLGVLLHQALTGHDPTENPFRFAPFTMPRPTGLWTFVSRMIDLDESKRPTSMGIVRRELERLAGAWAARQRQTGAMPGPAYPQGLTGPMPAWLPPQYGRTGSMPYAPPSTSFMPKRYPTQTAYRYPLTGSMPIIAAPHLRPPAPGSVPQPPMPRPARRRWRGRRILLSVILMCVMLALLILLMILLIHALPISIPLGHPPRFTAPSGGSIGYPSALAWLAGG